MPQSNHYACRWLGKGNSMQAVLEGSRTDPRQPLHDYTLTVITSDIRNAGTDADVFVDVTGWVYYPYPC